MSLKIAFERLEAAGGTIRIFTAPFRRADCLRTTALNVR